MIAASGGFRRVATALRAVCLLSGIALASALASSCGPSVQSIYEGDVRFEHCYRLDLDLNIAPSHREACWKQWLTSYTYGQPRDRIEYARRRVRAFGSGDVTRPSLDSGTQARSERRQFYLVVPEPTSAHASPPPLATVIPPSDSAAPPAPEPPRAPAATCAAACDSSWRSCETACAPDGGASETACKSCVPDYKRCMKRCFE
ncbi:MAG: hypothetical protein ACOY0T_32330 [Myxococcota bacterium]